MASTSRFRPTAVRARDIDRALTITALDNAYADGQMTFGEHRLRSERARSAVTLEDLHRLVSDLQLDVDLPEPVVRGAKHHPRVLLALGSVAIIAAGPALFFATRDGAEDDAGVTVVAAEPSAVPSVSMPVPVNVVPIVARPFVFDTAAGLEDFRARYIERFGSSLVLELSIQPADGRADVYRLDETGRVQRVMVSGGFEPQGETDLPDGDKRVFDWNALDSAVVAGVIAGAPQSIGAADGIATYVMIEDDGGEQSIGVSVDVPDTSGGRVETDFAGNPIFVRPATR